MEETERAAIYQLHASFCKALSDANRLLIINELSRGELPVGELTRRLGMTQSNVSKHLAMMREHGLVVARREGASVYCRLSDSRISEAIHLLREVQADQLEKRRALASGRV
ncbi:MAG: metalloregulator ArsR/SmtB family transcription factor [Chloroflexota bacterium]